MDQRGRDAAPRFTIGADIAEFKYHAVLVETVWVPTKLVFDSRDELRPERKSTDGVENLLPMGIYGFQRVEDRDKFCRRANAAAEADEHKICLPVTIPLEHLANAQRSLTGPVAEDQDPT